jgi:hypothetical protein
VKKIDEIKAFLTELGIDTQKQDGNLWVNRLDVELVANETEILEAIVTTFGKGFLWSRVNEMTGWLVLTSVY